MRRLEIQSAGDRWEVVTFLDLVDTLVDRPLPTSPLRPYRWNGSCRIQWLVSTTLYQLTSKASLERETLNLKVGAFSSYRRRLGFFPPPRHH